MIDVALHNDLSIIMRCLDGAIFAFGGLYMRRNSMISQIRDRRRRWIRTAVKFQAQREANLYVESNPLFCVLCENFYDGPLEAHLGCHECFTDVGVITKLELDNATFKEWLGPAFDVPEIAEGMSVTRAISLIKYANEIEEDIAEIRKALSQNERIVEPNMSRELSVSRPLKVVPGIVVPFTAAPLILVPGRVVPHISSYEQRKVVNRNGYLFYEDAPEGEIE